MEDLGRRVVHVTGGGDQDDATPVSLCSERCESVLGGFASSSVSVTSGDIRRTGRVVAYTTCVVQCWGRRL